MPNFLADEKLADVWGTWPYWLVDIGYADMLTARRIVGKVLKDCHHDATKADTAFRRVKDSRTVNAGNVVQYLRREVSND